MDWERLPASRWGLRQMGVVLLLASYSAGHHLWALVHGRTGDPPPPAYLLALMAFLCFSSGAALVLHGHHLFDKVKISERWRQPRPTIEADPTQAGEQAAHNDRRPDALENRLARSNSSHE